MTSGDGLLWSTVVVVLAAAIYQISIRERWRLVGKVAGLVVLLLVLVAGGIWMWSSHKARPVPLTVLSGVRLGMSPAEVKLAKGAPGREVSRRDGDEFKLAWVIGEDRQAALVAFFGLSVDSLRVGIVCAGRHEAPSGLGQYGTEQDIIAKLGQPTSVSINSAGLEKVISFAPLKVAYVLEKSQVTMMCISQSGVVIHAKAGDIIGFDAK